MIYDSIDVYQEYYVVKKGEKCSLVSQEGKVLIPTYSMFLSNSGERIVAIDNEALYIFSKSQNSIVGRYSIISKITDDEIFPVKNSRGLFGFLNRDGEIVLDFIYEEAYPFDKELGFAKAKRYGVTKYINKKGYICPLNDKQDIESFLRYKNGKTLGYCDNRFQRNGTPVKTYTGYAGSHGLDWIGPIVAPDIDNLLISSCRYVSICDNGSWAYSSVSYEYWEEYQYLRPLTKFYNHILQDARYGFPVFKQGDEAVVVNLIGATYRDEELEKLKQGHGLCPGWVKDGPESLYEEIKRWHEVEEKIKSFKPKYVYGEIGTELFRYQCEDLIPVLSSESHWRDNGSYHGTIDFIYKINGFFFKDKSGKYGVLNKDGEMIVSPIFSSVFQQSSNQSRKNIDIRNSQYYIVEINKKYGIYNTEFTEVLGINYDSIEHIDHDIFLIQKSGKYHFFRMKDKWISEYSIDFSEAMLLNDYEPKFKGINDFVFRSNGKLGAVNSELHIVVPFKFDFISRSQCWYANCEGTTAYKVRIGNDKEIGFDSWKSKNRYGIISPNGEVIVPIAFNKIDVIEDDYQHPIEYKVYKTVLRKESGRLCVYTDEGIYDEHGKEILPCNNWSIQRTTYDSNYIASYIVRQGTQMSVFNPSGAMVIEFQEANDITAVISGRMETPKINGYIIKKKWDSDDYEIVNEHGKRIAKLKCSSIYPEYNQMDKLQFYIAYSKIDGNWVSGIINPGGDIVLPIEMEKLHYVWEPSDEWGEELIKGFVGISFKNGKTYAITIGGKVLYCGTDKSIEELVQLIHNYERP